MFEIAALIIIVVGAAAYCGFYLSREWKSARIKKSCERKFGSNYACADCSQCTANGCRNRTAPSARAARTMKQYEVPVKK
ncbi:MAG: hypothetical protein AABZ39_15370 [Spirochaetota bacterium]